MKNAIPVYEPFLGEEEKLNVNECLDSSWISSKGKYIDEFEQRTKAYIGANYVSTVSNGTVALHTALLAAGISAGDEVITPNFTYVASTNSILMVGAKPVFIEINSDTWNINSDLIEAKISNKTKAILVTNVYGFPCNFDRLHEICSKHNLLLIEDAAESFGAEYGGQKSGSLADISTFSFFGNKTITTGEGGMVLTKSPTLFSKIEQLKNQGNSKDKRYYHELLGYNYRMTNIQAAIGCAQLDKLDEILKLKKKVDQFYRSNLSDIAVFQKAEPKSDSSFWMSSLLFENAQMKTHIEQQLEKNSVETRPLFFPIDELPFYEKSVSCKNANSLHARGLILPSFPGLSTEQLEYIVNIIRKNV